MAEAEGGAEGEVVAAGEAAGADAEQHSHSTTPRPESLRVRPRDRTRVLGTGSTIVGSTRRWCPSLASSSTDLQTTARVRLE